MHPHPAQARCDAAQAIDVAEFARIATRTAAVVAALRGTSEKQNEEAMLALQR